MKLSTRVRYGTRAMVDVGLHCAEGRVPLKDVAERQDISKKYLEHQTSRLEAVGLLRSRRGAGGGFTLAKPPSEIKLSEVFEILEGAVPLVECMENADLCPRSDTCAARDLWIEMGRILAAFLESKTLEDLCRQQREKEEAAQTADR